MVVLNNLLVYISLIWESNFPYGGPVSNKAGTPISTAAGERCHSHFIVYLEINMSDGFEGSPEYDDWIESGGRDEDRSYYYQKWQRRVRSS